MREFSYMIREKISFVNEISKIKRSKQLNHKNDRLNQM